LAFQQDPRLIPTSLVRRVATHVLVVIHDDCPIHQIVHAPMDDVIGKDPPHS